MIQNIAEKGEKSTSSRWAEIADIQSVAGTPLPDDDFRREYIGLRGLLQTNATEPERKGRLCFVFTDISSGKEFEIRSSLGQVQEQVPSRLVYQSAHAKYIIALL